MGRSVFAEDRLLSKLKSLSKDSGFTFGLILGQNTSQKDYIVHFAASPPPEKEDASEAGGDICCVKDLGEYEDSWISSHTRNVLKMLPGGMSVIGVFITCPNASSDAVVFNKLRTLAIHSYNSIKNNNFLHLDKNSNRLLLQFSTNNKMYICKSFDAGSLNASLQSTDLKFSNELFVWYRVDSSINLSNFGPFFVTIKKEGYTLKKMLKDILLIIQSKIDNCECSIDGKFVELTDNLKTFKEKEEKNIKELEKSTGKKLSFDSKSCTVQLYDRKVPNDFSFKVDHVDQQLEVIFNGDICSRIFVVGSSTLADVIKAVKEDLIRCCSTKFEMHWETNDVPICSNNGGKTTEDIHMLPRRVLFNLPETNVQFSEYLFLDETAEDIIPSIEENLSVQIEQDSILDVLEPKTEPSIPAVPEKNSKKSVARSNESQSNIILLAVGILSFFVLLISIYIQFS